MEPGLTLYTSNRLDVLVERLADLLGREPLPPLEQEIVVVQSQGMQRWTTLELARLHGIAGSLSTPFPRPFARYLADRVLDRRDLPPSEAVGRGEASLFARGILTWRLFGLLGRAMEKSEEAGALAVPAAYLADDGDQRRRYQLATRLGSLFDDYQIFRPDLLSEWQQGAADVSDSSMAGWQGVLWRRLVSEATERDEPEAPFSDRLRRLVTRLRHGATPRGLPRRRRVTRRLRRSEKGASGSSRSVASDTSLRHRTPCQPAM
ncbi:MAG: exodeoxyribonuclease V subunit gamma, partial [Acidobacteriota bacterium]